MKIVNKWNRFIELMIATKKAWEDLREQSSHSITEWDRLSPLAQKILTIGNRKAKFEVAMPRLMDFWRGHGGVETLRISVRNENILRKTHETEENENAQEAA